MDIDKCPECSSTSITSYGVVGKENTVETHYLCGDCSNIFYETKKSMTTKKYEHDSWNLSPINVDAFIRDQGEEGWCLVGIIQYGEDFKVFMVKEKYE